MRLKLAAALLKHGAKLENVHPTDFFDDGRWAQGEEGKIKEFLATNGDAGSALSEELFGAGS